MNGTRLGEAEKITPPRDIKHGDIIQIGVDYSSEADPYGKVPDAYKCVQCMALYGYKARLDVPLKDEIM